MVLTAPKGLTIAEAALAIATISVLGLAVTQIERALKSITSQKERKGFTLPEVAAVVAITGTLAAIVVPIVLDKITTARQIAADTEAQNVATAIATLYNDTTEFPTRKGTERDQIEVLRSGGNSSLDPAFASGISSLWGLTEVDDINNHLLKDNPGGTANGYKDNNGVWRGPYIGDMGQDPWGRNYMVIAKGFYDAGTSEAPIYAWVLSAGPNETIETDKDSNTLNSNPTTGMTSNGDDIGYLMLSGGI